MIIGKPAIFNHSNKVICTEIIMSAQVKEYVASMVWGCLIKEKGCCLNPDTSVEMVNGLW